MNQAIAGRNISLHHGRIIDANAKRPMLQSET
jgi:hypothetical protein